MKFHSIQCFLRYILKVNFIQCFLRYILEVHFIKCFSRYILEVNFIQCFLRYILQFNFIQCFLNVRYNIFWKMPHFIPCLLRYLLKLNFIQCFERYILKNYQFYPMLFELYFESQFYPMLFEVSFGKIPSFPVLCKVSFSSICPVLTGQNGAPVKTGHCGNYGWACLLYQDDWVDCDPLSAGLRATD